MGVILILLRDGLEQVRSELWAKLENFANKRVPIISTLGAISADRDNAVVLLFWQNDEAEVHVPQQNQKQSTGGLFLVILNAKIK